MKKVLFAHQSTIPHYRLPFYEALCQHKPNTWTFDVVVNKHRYQQLLKLNTPVGLLPVSEYKMKIKGTTIRFQKFLPHVKDYDLVVLEDALNNLSYPLTHLFKPSNTKIAYWGHGRDVTSDHPSRVKRCMEYFKLNRIKLSNGYFAYMPAVKRYLVENGVDAHKIFEVYNTIDIDKERKYYETLAPEIKHINRRTLIFVGRLTASKNIEFLLDVFLKLSEINSSYEFTIIGDGDLKYKEIIRDRSSAINLHFLGEITDTNALGKILAKNCLYVFPGLVGLGPLHAMCYNLVPVIKESPFHKPEIEYLNNENSIILPESATPTAFAKAIDGLVGDVHKFETMRRKTWGSIREFTIENMAKRFINGINAILLDQ